MVHFLQVDEESLWIHTEFFGNFKDNWELFHVRNTWDNFTSHLLMKFKFFLENLRAIDEFCEGVPSVLGYVRHDTDETD